MEWGWGDLKMSATVTYAFQKKGHSRVGRRLKETLRSETVGDEGP